MEGDGGTRTVNASIARSACRRAERLETAAGPLWFGATPTGGPIAGWEALDSPPDHAGPPRPEWNLADRLTRHFAGCFDDFHDLPLPDGPEFFRACWRALRDSQPGERWSYRELAARAGRPAAVRAAGVAMRRNPAPILIPCHRVVGSDGALGGYAGGWGDSGRGGAIKRFLLELESAPGSENPSGRGQLGTARHR